MGVIKSNQLQSALLKKGFRKGSGDHNYFYLWVDGKETPVRTKISHGAMHDLDDYLQGCHARDMKLSKAQLRAFAECSLTFDAYVQVLRNQDEL